MGQGTSAEQTRSPFDDPDPMSSASVPPAAATPLRLTLIPTVLQWSHGGRMVYVTGTFNNWAERIPMRQSRNDFTVCLNLPVGTFQYKFIVDNEWRFSPSQPLVQDAQGNVNNCITVLDEEDFMSEPIAAQGNGREDSMFGNDPNMPRYGQSFADDAMHLAKDPPPLPCQLTTMCEELSLPLPCTLLHLCWKLPDRGLVMAASGPLATTANLIVVSAAHRYRSKFITLLLYKPTRRRGDAALAQAQAQAHTQPQAQTHQQYASAGLDASGLSPAGRPQQPQLSAREAAQPQLAREGQQHAQPQNAQLVAASAYTPRPPSLMQIDDQGLSPQPCPALGGVSQMAV